jgi:hypothetical protein
MKYCKLCLQNNYRPNTFFSKNGICPACVYYNSIKNEDWDSRIEILKDIINKYTHVKKKKGFDFKVDQILSKPVMIQTEKKN